MAQRRLEDKQFEEKTNTGCLVKEQEKVYIDIKVEANIMITEVHSQEGAEGNVAEKKKVNESKKANLGNLLKYNACSTRWSPASRIRLFIKGKKNGRKMLDSIDEGPLVYATVVGEDGLPPDVYSLVNHQEAAKDI
nr:zinc finger, CCHC-type [Tanacetum cinerariifolium]